MLMKEKKDVLYLYSSQTVTTSTLTEISAWKYNKGFISGSPLLDEPSLDEGWSFDNADCWMLQVGESGRKKGIR